MQFLVTSSPPPPSSLDLSSFGTLHSNNRGGALCWKPSGDPVSQPMELLYDGVLTVVSGKKPRGGRCPEPPGPLIIYVIAPVIPLWTRTPPPKPLMTHCHRRKFAFYPPPRGRRELRGMTSRRSVINRLPLDVLLQEKNPNFHFCQ